MRTAYERARVNASTNMCLVSTVIRVMNFSGTNWGHAPAKSFHTAGKLLRNEMQLKCVPPLSCCTPVIVCVCACAYVCVLDAGNVVVCSVNMRVFEHV